MPVAAPQMHIGRCPRCGARLPPDIEDTTCPYCGSQLEREKVPALTVTSEEELAASFRRPVPETLAKKLRAAKRFPVRKIVMSGILSMVAIVLTVTEMGFIPWVEGASLTIVHVPVIVGAVLAGPLAGLLIGLVFGVCNLLQGMHIPNGPVDVCFTNPLASVVPRLFIGPMAWLVYRTLRRKSETCALVVASVAGSLTNTILAFGALGLLGFLPWTAIGTIAVVNGIPEAIFAAIVMWAIAVVQKRIEQGRRSSAV